jgi:Alternative complex III, ActD subunit
MKARDGNVYGILAQFSSPEALLIAARQTYVQGYRQLEAFTPFPVEGLAEAIGRKSSRVPLIVLLGGIIGGCTGYFMQLYALAIYYPLNVGSRPLNSWPLFIPVTFELTVLFGSLAGIVGMLILNKLPCLYHPLFGITQFARATSDQFFLCVEASDPLFDAAKVRAFLSQFEAHSVTEVPG